MFFLVGVICVNFGEKDSWINSLVLLIGKVGYVNIFIGLISVVGEEKVIVLIKIVIVFVCDMGGNLLKYFLMKGLVYEEEYCVVVKVCVEEGFVLELIGGIDKENFEIIVCIVFEVNVE